MFSSPTAAVGQKFLPATPGRGHLGATCPGALALARVLRSLALGVDPHDPLAFAIATLVLGTVVLIAGYLPARRATRVNPLEVLQSD